MDIENGTYAARPVAVSVTESKAGNLMAVVSVQVQGGPELRFYSVMAMHDGTLNTRNIDSLKKWSGWDGADPYWLMSTDLTGVDVEVVIENEPGLTDPNKLWPTVKWINPPGSGGGGALPPPVAKDMLAAKYGAKFRALAGGTPVAARATAPTPVRAAVAPTAAAPVRSAPPVAPARKTATQASAWALLNDKAGPMAQGDKEGLWFGFVDATGSDQADMTAEGWAQVEAAITAHFDSGEQLPF